MTTWLYPIIAVGLGMLLTLQPLINAILTRAVGNGMAATTVSGLVTFLSALALLVLSGRAGDFGRALTAPVPWWVYLAGMVGTAFVFGAMSMAPVIGAAGFFVCIVAGQLIGATLVDHFGAFGIAVRTISLERVIGLALVLIGAVLVQRG